MAEKAEYLVIVAFDSSHAVRRNWNWFRVIDNIVFKWRVWWQLQLLKKFSNVLSGGG